MGTFADHCEHVDEEAAAQDAQAGLWRGQSGYSLLSSNERASLGRACLLFDDVRLFSCAETDGCDHCPGGYRHESVAVENAYRPLGYAVGCSRPSTNFLTPAHYQDCPLR